MRTFFQALTGANCTVGGQTILSLNATEDMDADYATASAVCLAPDGALEKGIALETIEGGISTGYWEIEEAVRMRSGEKTWRRRMGEGFAHIPYVTYRLRGKGYLAARATLSKATVGADQYPPKFCTTAHYSEIQEALLQRKADGEIDYFGYLKELKSWHIVTGPADIIMTLCGWVALPVAFGARLEACAPEYMPVSKSVIGACKEVAGWSGASCYLDRTGTLIIYDWQEAFNRGGTVPTPATVLDQEDHDAVYPTHICTVVGKGKGRYWHPAEPGHFRAPGGDPTIPKWVDPRPGFWVYDGTEKAVEVTQQIDGGAGEWPVEERIEISEYPINPSLANKLALLALCKSVLLAGTVVYKGPAEGLQGIAPITSHCFRVSRTLEWTGNNGYRYEMEIVGPRAKFVPGTGTSKTGWW